MVKLVERIFFGRLGKPVEPLIVNGEAGETDLLRRHGKPVEPLIMDDEIGETDLLRKAREAGRVKRYGR
jgi:hypothetical protein